MINSNLGVITLSNNEVVTVLNESDMINLVSTFVSSEVADYFKNELQDLRTEIFNLQGDTADDGK